MSKKVLLTATVQSHIVQFHRPLAALFHAKGYEVHVAARNNLAEKNGLTLDFADEVYDIPFCRSPFRPGNLTAMRQLKAVLRMNEYEIIQCNTPVGGVLTRLCATHARNEGTRVVYTSHGFIFYKGSSATSWLIYYPVEKLLARYRTDLLLTVNNEDYALAKEKFSCPVGHIHGVGVDPTRYTPASPDERKTMRASLGLPADAPLLLCVGELLPNKNQSMLLNALPAVIAAQPDVHLLLAGNGPSREALETLAAARGVSDHVTFLGYTTRLQEYQKAVDLTVSCSRREGLGLNLIEAMLTGNPVVATDNRGHRELVMDGVNGYLVPLGDTAALSDRILRVLNHPDRALEMGREGYRMAQAYTVPAVSEELERFFFPTDMKLSDS